MLFCATVMFKFFTISIFTSFLLPLLLSVADAAPPLQHACNAPPLPSPSGMVVIVSTESALQAAVNSITSGTTIMLQPGTYNLTGTLWLNRNVENIAIRGSTDSCDDVVLIGRGMSNANYGNVPTEFGSATLAMCQSPTSPFATSTIIRFSSTPTPGLNPRASTTCAW